MKLDSKFESLKIFGPVIEASSKHLNDIDSDFITKLRGCFTC